jgi:Rieske Fe-S protein
MTQSTRRVVLAAGGAGAAALLAGCGGGSDTSSGTKPPPAATGEPSPTAAPSTAPPTTAAPPAGALAKTADIPAGGGKVFPDQKVVVTQPAAGQFKAFSAVCTHMGCTVGSVSGGTIRCPCHGSQYSIADGTVVGGPAPRPLPARQVAVVADSITVTG